MDDSEFQPAGGDCREGSVGTKKIDLRHQGQLQDLTGKVHHLPCCIRHNGPCAVSDYFKPNKTGVVLDGLEVEETSFRGRKLRGATLQIPDGYCGYVVKKKGNCSDDNSIGWEASAKFQNVTYWNHDNHPSLNDAFARSFQWFIVADALHKPVQTNALTSSHANGE